MVQTATHRSAFCFVRERILVVRKFHVLSIVPLVMFLFLFSTGTAFASDKHTASTSLTPSASDSVNCFGTECDQYKAQQTQCASSTTLLQDVPIYYSGGQAGTLRFWYSPICSTYWTQVFSTDCTNIDNFEAVLYAGPSGSVLAEQHVDFGFEGGCSLSGYMYYVSPDSLEKVQGGGGIGFTDARTWIYAPDTNEFN
jgi:hypothetical protein